MRAVLLLGACALAVYGCERKPEVSGAEQAKPVTAAAVCASPETYAQLKQIVFDQAAKAAPAAGRLAVANLGQQSTARVDLAVLDSEDRTISKTTCSGRLAVTFPATASALFGGSAPATADVRYTIQPAANGQGSVYAIEGAGSVIEAIAQADLSAWVAQSAQAAATAPEPGAASSAPPPAAGAAAAPPRPPFDAVAAIRSNPKLSARMARVNTMLANAVERDVNGDVQAEQAAALRDLRRCGDVSCVQGWFGRREASLGKWQD